MKNTPKNINEKKWETYLKGNLSASEKAEWDNYLQNNPFEAEALEGLAMLSESEREKDLNDLKKQLPHYQKNKKIGLAVAASVIFALLSFSLAFWLLNKPEPEIMAIKTQKQENQKEELKNKTEIPLTTETKDKKQTEQKTQKVEVLPKEENKKNISPETADKEIQIDTKKDDADLKEEVKSAENQDINPKIEEVEESNKEERKPEIGRSDKFSAGMETNTKVPITAPNKEKKHKSKKIMNAGKSAENKDEAEMLIEIKGQVLDYQSKKAVEKVEIRLKNTNNKTYSDKFGNFSLQVSEKNATLVLSKAGYLTQEVSNLTNQKLTIFLQSKP